MTFSHIRIGLIIFFVCLFWNSELKATSNTNKKFLKTITLSNSFVLKIFETRDERLWIDLRKKESRVKAISIGYSSSRDELIVPTNLDSKGGKYYFITTYHRGGWSSKNIIAWENKDHWDIILVPFDNCSLEDRDNDGVFDIIDNDLGIIFSFSDGQFVRKKL